MLGAEYDAAENDERKGQPWNIDLLQIVAIEHLKARLSV
jgi:hypothetical protein